MLSLNRIDLATAADKKSGLDYRARFFLATTWEEVKALARDREALQAVAETMYDVNADAKKRALFEARRKYREIMTTTKNKLARLEAQVEEYRQEIDQYRQRITELETQLAAKK